MESTRLLKIRLATSNCTPMRPQPCAVGCEKRHADRLGNRLGVLWKEGVRSKFSADESRENRTVSPKIGPDADDLNTPRW